MKRRALLSGLTASASLISLPAVSRELAPTGTEPSLIRPHSSVITDYLLDVMMGAILRKPLFFVLGTESNEQKYFPSEFATKIRGAFASVKANLGYRVEAEGNIVVDSEPTTIDRPVGAMGLTFEDGTLLALTVFEKRTTFSRPIPLRYVISVR